MIHAPEGEEFHDDPMPAGYTSAVFIVGEFIFSYISRFRPVFVSARMKVFVWFSDITHCFILNDRRRVWFQLGGDRRRRARG